MFKKYTEIISASFYDKSQQIKLAALCSFSSHKQWNIQWDIGTGVNQKKWKMVHAEKVADPQSEQKIWQSELVCKSTFWQQVVLCRKKHPCREKHPCRGNAHLKTIALKRNHTNNSRLLSLAFPFFIYCFFPLKSIYNCKCVEILLSREPLVEIQFKCTGCSKRAKYCLSGLLQPTKEACKVA